jgi:ribose transport system permease protein
MSDSRLPKPRAWNDWRNFVGLPLLAILGLVCLLAGGRGLDIAAIGIWVGTAIPLVIAAIGQTQIILAGGQGLAAGSASIFVNAFVITHVGQSTSSVILWSLSGILLGGGIGASNGILIGFLRLPSTAVTLATNFILGGVTLGLADAAASAAPIRTLGPVTLLGSSAPIAIVVVLLLISWLLDRSSVGRRIRLAGEGGWTEIDRRSGTWVMATYVIAGVGYGFSGVLFAALSGAVDPVSGGLSLAEIYTAVILGGSVPYLRQGSTLGSAVAALFVGSLSYVTTLLDMPEYSAPILVTLLLLGGLWLVSSGISSTTVVEPPAARLARFPVIWLALPIGCIAIAWAGHEGALLRIDPIILVFAALLALAQASVVITGHFDMSLPAMTAFATAACLALGQGSDIALVWIVPLLLLIGFAVGFANGASSLIVKAPRVLITLATGHLLETISMMIVIAFPFGFAPSRLMAFVDPNSSGLSPACYIAAVIFGGSLALAALYRLRPRWAKSAAITPRRRAFYQTAPILHGLAGFLAATVGILLAGYGGNSSDSTADPFTLPALLAVGMAGFTVGRRGGHPWLLLLSVPLVAAVDTLMVGLGLGYPTRAVVMGSALLVSIAFQSLVTLSSPAATSR